MAGRKPFKFVLFDEEFVDKRSTSGEETKRQME